MTKWRPDPNVLKRPVYRSLARSMIAAIERGDLKPGDRLPTHRELAYDLGISVQTVSRAYDELIRLDAISGEVGRGSFVRAGGAEPRPPYQSGAETLIECSMLKPVTGAIQAECMAATLAELARDLPPEAIFSFRPRASLAPHRDVALRWLARTGVAPKPEQVLLTNGSTPAMMVALMTAAKPGHLVVTEELGHHTLKPLARDLGLRIAGLATDAEGVLPGAFERACAAQDVRVLYVMPAGLNPMAQVMGAARRAEIVEIARRHDVLIVENDAWGPIASGRAAPLVTLAPERTFYFSGFSKCVLPGLRIAYLVVPERLVSAATNRHLATNWMATGLMAEIASRWIFDGTAETLLRWQQKALARRNRMAARAFDGLSFNASPNGLHVWLDLPRPWREDAFVTLARLNGVAVAPGAAFAIPERVGVSGVRVCLGAPEEAALEAGLATIAALARNEPEPAFLAI